MAQNQNLGFPYFPFPPPHAFPFSPPFHPVAPPLPHPPPFPAPTPPKPSNPPPTPIPKPPTPHVSPPTPAAKPPKPSNPPPSPIPKPPPHSFSPPPPSPRLPPPHPSLPPPPPHIVPTPPLPPPAPGHHSAVIIVVFVSLGAVFFLAFLAAALFCFLKKRKKKQFEYDNFEIDERMKVHETIVPGPHGEQAVLVTFEEDIHAHETKIKDEIVGETSHAGAVHHSKNLIEQSSLGTGHHHVENNTSGTT